MNRPPKCAAVVWQLSKSDAMMLLALPVWDVFELEKAVNAKLFPSYGSQIRTIWQLDWMWRWCFLGWTGYAICGTKLFTSSVLCAGEGSIMRCSRATRRSGWSPTADISHELFFYVEPPEMVNIWLCQYNGCHVQPGCLGSSRRSTKEALSTLVGPEEDPCRMACLLGCSARPAADGIDLCRIGRSCSHLAFPRNNDDTTYLEILHRGFKAKLSEVWV